jgi:hypothetical protein
MRKILKIWEGRDIKDKKAFICYFFSLSICMSGDPSGDRKSEQERERENEKQGLYDNKTREKE